MSILAVPSHMTKIHTRFQLRIVYVSQWQAAFLYLFGQ
jgi:hypothetical protein